MEPLKLVLAIMLMAGAEKGEVTLGEPVVMKVTLRNDGGAPFEGPALALDRRSVTLLVGEGKDQFVYQHSLDDAPPLRTLAPGESWETTIELTPLRAGKLAIEASYAEKATAETTVEVKPSAGSGELGARLETSKGAMTIRFLPEAAPNTAAHFANLVRKGYYDGLKFHRIIKGFMAQGGDPTGTGSGGPGYQMPAEFSRDPRFAHTFGRLSMARTSDPNSAGSQFFVCFDGARQLDGKYTVFAEVIEGEDVVRKLEAAGRDPRDGSNGVPPLETITIRKATLVPVTPKG